MNPIKVENLHKRFGDIHVLRGLSFELQPGEGAILLGANGCGKSTMMRCLNGLERPTEGRIQLGGTELASASRGQLRAARREVGVVFQRFNLVSNLGVLQNVLYGAMGRYRGGLLRTLAPFAPAEERERAMACLERVRLRTRPARRRNTSRAGSSSALPSPACSCRSPPWCWPTSLSPAWIRSRVGKSWNSCGTWCVSAA